MNVQKKEQMNERLLLRFSSFFSHSAHQLRLSVRSYDCLKQQASIEPLWHEKEARLVNKI